jgi:phosphoglycolate phosphatase
MKLRAVLFDFDGTLADAYPGITASVNHVRASYGLPPLSEAEVRRHVGRGPDRLMKETVPGCDVATALARYRAHHPSVMRTGTRLLPGAAETLEALRQAGLRLAICSNKPRRYTVELVDYLGLTGRVDAILGPEDVPRPKPAPDMLLKALHQFGVPPAEALYVGDMAIDVQVARAAGVAVCVVPTGSDDRASLEAAGPDRLLDGLGDLPGICCPGGTLGE